MKQKIIFFVMFLASICCYAQQKTELRGNVINKVTGDPMPGVMVTVRGQNHVVVTDQNGSFHFNSISAGECVITLSSGEIVTREVAVNIKTDTITLLKDITAIVVEKDQNLAMIGIGDELLLDDDGISSQEISSAVILSNDQYLSHVGYQLSPLRFKVRGYQNIYEQKYINGVAFNDQNRGVFNFASIGALNDMTRNGDAVNYTAPNAFTFGSIGGAENINMRASNYARGTKLTLSYTNRIYYLRGMAAHSTGLQDNGWAVTAAIGGRYSDEGNIEGTFYRNLSYAIAVEKQWNEGRHSLSFTTFGSPVERGQQGASFQEAYDLKGNNLYNPNWGWQNGRKRNARVVKAYDPTAILSHIWKINEHMALTSGIGAHYARYGNTALNWYNAPDPRPDYYRYMPSYHSENEEVYNYYKELWQRRCLPVNQINWYNMYNANRLANFEDKSGVYMLEERRSDLMEVSVNSTLNAQINRNSKLTVGMGLRSSLSKQFKTVDDMLGATYFLDVDKFAERDFPGDSQIIQNDLNKPDRKVYEGDTFGYDFHLNINSGSLWVQNEYTTPLIDLYYGSRITYTSFWRDGQMKNGRYPNNSYGKGKKHSFTDFAAKAGAAYKISGRHLITSNVSYMSEAPLPNNTYISPRISDDAIQNIESGRVFSADLNYIFSLPTFKGRVGVFQTSFFNQTKRISYYHDSERTFVNHVLSNLNITNRGVELGMAYQINNNWSIDLAGTMAEYYYSNNPDGIISYENGKEADIRETVYLKNYYVGATPQIAGTLGINFFYNYWFFNLNLNAFGRNYIEISPLRRLASNYAGLNPNNAADLEAYHLLTHQERFGSGYTLDFSIGKMFYLSNRRAINFNLSFNNITNRKNIKTGGYEQGRIDVSAPRKFASKYYYMQGFNCFLNASYRF